MKLQAESGLAETRRKEHKNSPWCSIQYDLTQEIERICVESVCRDYKVRAGFPYFMEALLDLESTSFVYMVNPLRPASYVIKPVFTILCICLTSILSINGLSG